MRFLSACGIYPNHLKNRLLGLAKAPIIDDRKSVRIALIRTNLRSLRSSILGSFRSSRKTGFSDGLGIVAFLLIAAQPLRSQDSNFVDLEEMAQDFVLETQKIDLPGYPNAFNPSIVRWQGRVLFSFRTYNPVNRYADQIGLVWLNDHFQVSDKPQLLAIPWLDPSETVKRQDPRLVTISNHLFIVYNNVLKDSLIRRMVFAQIHFDGRFFTVDQPECILSFDQEDPKKSEKNWVPFDYQDHLLLARFINPHWILEPIYGTVAGHLIASTQCMCSWKWGELRGGTPGQLIDGEYLAFFHSSVNIPTVHSKGKVIQHYFMGAYTFAAEPPFQLTRISPCPIVGKRFYEGKEYRTWKPLHVVFPGGFVSDEENIWIAYGRQDHEVWIVKLDKKKLFSSLIPVSQQ